MDYYVRAYHGEEKVHKKPAMSEHSFLRGEIVEPNIIVKVNFTVWGYGGGRIFHNFLLKVMLAV